MSLLATLVPERVRREAGHYRFALGRASRNVRLYLISIPLSTLAVMVPAVLYNLYLLELGYDEVLVGQVLGAVSLGVMVGGIPSGFLYNRLGARLTFSLSLVLIMITRLLQLTVADPRLIIGTSFLFGIASAILSTIWLPFLANESTPAERPYFLSLHSMSWLATEMVGSMVAGLLPTAFIRFLGVGSLVEAQRAAMLVSVLTMLAAVVPLLLMRDAEHRQAAAPAASNAPEEVYETSRLRGFITCTVVVFFVGMIIGVASFANVYFSEFHQATTQQIGFLVALSRLTSLIGISVLPAFSQRAGMVKTNVAFALVTAGFLVALGLPLPFAISSVLFLLGYGFLRANNLLFFGMVMEVIPPQDRGTQASIRITSSFLAQALAGVIGGRLVVGTGYLGLFLFGAASAVLAALTSWLFYRNTPVNRPSRRLER